MVNGIDTSEWSPACDPHLHGNGYAPYIAATLDDGKARCKAALQRVRGLGLSWRGVWGSGSGARERGRWPRSVHSMTRSLLGSPPPAPAFLRLPPIRAQELGLPVDPAAPMLGFIGRLDAQKGVDLICDNYEWLMEQGVQLVLLGSGSPELESALQ